MHVCGGILRTPIIKVLHGKYLRNSPLRIETYNSNLSAHSAIH